MPAASEHQSMVCACRVVTCSAAAPGTGDASGLGLRLSLSTAEEYPGSCQGAAPSCLEPALRGQPPHGQGSSDRFCRLLLFCKDLSSWLSRVRSAALCHPCAPQRTLCSWWLFPPGHFRAQREEDAGVGGRGHYKGPVRLLRPRRIHSASSPVTSWAPAAACNGQKWEHLLLAEESRGSHETPSVSVLSFPPSVV